MNIAVIVARNGRAYVRSAIESLLAQTVPVRVIAVDNGSTDGAAQLLHTYRSDAVETVHYHPQVGVAHAWNRGLEHAWEQGAEHALVINTDVVLRPDTYELLLADGGGFVTCVGVRGREVWLPDGSLRAFDGDGREIFPAMPNPTAKRPHPDFSCYLIRRSTWDAVGPFDEGYRGAFCEDWDYHVRLHLAGIDAHCIDMPFYHYASMTVKAALPDAAEAILRQAKHNRARFKARWGVEGGSAGYYALFGHGTPTEMPKDGQ